MSLLTLQNIEIAFGDVALLENANLVIERGDRLGVVGRNGAGKSTLLKLIAGSITADDGILKRDANAEVAMLEQTVPAGMTGSTVDVVSRAGLNESSSAVETDIQLQQRAERVLSRLDLDATVDFETLSGGLKRRVLLARALVNEPDLLLLDEPTNHLDIESIAWLEGFFKVFGGALILVTHDRRFLKKIATGIVDIDRGRLTVWQTGYDEFLRRKQAELESEERAQHKFDKKLQEEERWIRQGIKARRTRNEGRVRRLKTMREERKARRDTLGVVKAQIEQSNRSGKIVIESKGVCFHIDAKPIVSNFDAVIQRGDRIALIGPNGAGKTTLLRLLQGELQPDSGSITHGTRLEIAYFDQHRAKLGEKLSAQENVAGGREQLEINGKSKHVISYMQDFLFTPQRARAPISALSGGERSRLLLARLFSTPSNLLIMDEPTNDLDIETLELLEELLLDYAGTLLLVSHDREFIDQVATNVWSFGDNGQIEQTIGGYQDWQRQRSQQAKNEKLDISTNRSSATKSKPATPARKKLSYKEQRELDQLPLKIDQLEKDIERLQFSMSKPDYYQQPGARISSMQQELEQLQSNLESAFERWATLES